MKTFVHRVTVLRTKHQQNACAPHIWNAKQHRQIQFPSRKAHETSFEEPGTISFIAWCLNSYLSQYRTSGLTEILMRWACLLRTVTVSESAMSMNIRNLHPRKSGSKAELDFGKTKEVLCEWLSNFHGHLGCPQCEKGLPLGARPVRNQARLFMMVLFIYWHRGSPGQDTSLRDLSCSSRASSRQP